MSRSANELIAIPATFWDRPETTTALRGRDIGRLFVLLRQYAGASQTQIAIACGLTQGKVSFIMRGIQQVEKLDIFERIADGLSMPDPARTALGLAPRSSAPGPSRPAPHVPGILTLNQESREEEQDPVRRRIFVGLTGTSALGAVFGDLTPDREAIDAEALAPVLTDHPGNTGLQPPDIAVLTAEANQARRQYQACRYAELLAHLPQLLTRLYAACMALTGDDRRQALVLSADTHHVAAGLLLKLDDRGLAYLAADRSMRAAQASEDPIAVGASARIITHTLMNGSRLAAAVSTANDYAARLDRDMPSHTSESLSVYGSLLLRGAVAAAKHDQRATAHDMLDEADDAAQRLGTDGNLYGTAFGPTNAKLHRVNIAVTLGDAGTAVDVARNIDLNAIDVTERKAALLIDTARAFLQWGRHEKAYTALRAAEEIAPEEVADRPSVHLIVRELVATAPLTLRRDAEEFATQIGVSR
jgi:transcriptional regulator with XRE-family HTH domain/tetratricopeptide (TPR) repeat protein